MLKEELELRLQREREIRLERRREHYNLARDLGFNAYEANVFREMSKDNILDAARELGKLPGHKCRSRSS